MFPIQPVTSAYEIEYLKETSSINNREYRLDNDIVNTTTLHKSVRTNYVTLLGLIKVTIMMPVAIRAIPTAW